MSGQTGAPVVGVWNPTVNSSNTTDTSLTPGSRFGIDINVTNTPRINGYEFYLYYDPAYLTAFKIDEQNSTIFSNRQPSVLAKNITQTTGVVRVSVVALGGAFPGGNGTLAHINFTVAGTGLSPLTLAAGVGKTSNFAQAFTRLVLGYDTIEADTADGYFKNHPSKLGPVATFMASPALPLQGQTVTFNAGLSFDADNATMGADRGIGRYLWEYGDGNSNTTRAPTSSHIYGPPAGQPYTGNFSVRLTVVDYENFIGMKTERLMVALVPTHDLTIQTLQVLPARVSPGAQVQVSVIIFDTGTFDENFSLTVRNIGPPEIVIGTVMNEEVISRGTFTRTFTYDTTGLTPQLYSIEANVTISGFDDDASSDNSRRVLLTVLEQSSSSILFVVAGVAVLIAALVAVSVLLRRRRKKEDLR